MDNSIDALESHRATKDYLICIDSDGCAFDTMELKHKECFIPNIIQHWGLQAISKFAREAAEFVNLYSKWRGANRFPALLTAFDLLGDWDRVAARKVRIPPAPNLRKWVATESKLGNPALEKYCAEHDEADMHQALRWSKAVNQTVDAIVQGGVPPFPFVRESLERAAEQAEMMVCSQTPTVALEREWEEQGLAEFVFAIAGQEMGTKTQHIALAAQGGYPPEKILMIGDAPGDLKAARANGALFFPIDPGDEDASWKRLHDEGLDKFFAGTFAGSYEDALIARFDALLPDKPHWQ